MQTLYVPKYGIHYRVNPKNPCELQWSKKPFGPMTAWQKAYTFKRPIRALDIDDETDQGVVVLNDSTTYVGSGVRVWGKKFYTAGSRIYSLYAIGESKMTRKLTIKVHESTAENIPDALKNKLRNVIDYEYGNGKCVAFDFEPTHEHNIVFLYNDNGTILDYVNFGDNYNAAKYLYDMTARDIKAGRKVSNHL